MTSHNKNSNRLTNEKSPYLLQHAHNPVDWFPWSEEAFEKALRENKPVFLSIGYSTCHWCHVMERESFEDIETAELMNKIFVSIKVDREERPDIDNIYMTVCQMMTGSGGWPLSIIMTADKKPFFSGTYFPKESKYGRIGFKELINNINEAWVNKRSEIESSADELTSYLQKINNSSGATIKLNPDILTIAYNNFETRFDPVNGGFGSSPKFPSPHNLMFLLRYWKRTSDYKVLEIVTKTLTEMRKGGIFDHIGFGFHRYSTDKNWLVPHFEKMLYDQALLVMAYTEAYQATQNFDFKKTAEEIIQYVLRDMTSPEGGFYSAEDADSEGLEGKFYLWTQGELYKILGKNDSDLAFNVFNTNPHGNFHEEATGKSSGENILNLSKPLDEIAININTDKGNLIQRIESIRQKLFTEREKRAHPFKDDKILADWNGLMIAALAKAGSIFNNNNYIAAAEKSFSFIEKYLTNKDGKLLHRYRDGDSSIRGSIDDYAFLIWGLIELYEATFKASYLTKAVELTDIVLKHYWDESNGGFFFTPNFGENLLVRTKEIYDGAIPSGNSVMLYNLIRIARMTSVSIYENYANSLIDYFSESVQKAPSGSSFLLSTFEFMIGPGYEIIIVGDRENPETQNIINSINQKFIPNKVMILKDPANSEFSLAFEYLNSYSQINSKSTIYVCKNFQCNLPTTDISKVFSMLT
ncbi:MAG: thioredoxin domain-containing protein [Melioribacter sp.]|nr:thioredoxin domain-containing protein [Melioribacter sp.]